ncbi:hypothetical protein [Cupriavidus sp. CP313]
MKTLRCAIGLAAALAWSGFACAQAEPGLRAEAMQSIARDAYLYGYPLVLMDVTRQQFTNYAQPTGISVQGPASRFIHILAEGQSAQPHLGGSLAEGRGTHLTRVAAVFRSAAYANHTSHPACQGPGCHDKEPA